MSSMPKRRSTKSKATRRRKTPDRRKLEVEYVPVKKLKLWKDNPRTNDKAAEKLCELLAAHGFINPVIATRDYVVRAGNTRLKSARKLEYDKIPVIFVDFKSEAEAAMYALAENRSHEFATWHDEMLGTLFQKHDELDLADRSRMSGFVQEEIAGLTTEYPDLPPGVDPSSLPTPLDPSTLSSGRGCIQSFIISYHTAAERSALLKFLGVDGKKTVYSWREIKAGRPRRRK